MPSMRDAKRGRMQAGGIDQQPATQRHRLGAADIDLDAALRPRARAVTGLKKTSTAPAFSASPCSASM